MNKLLMEARKNMRGQKGKVQTGFNNTPVPEGKYICVVKKSEIKDRSIQDVVQPVHVLQLSILMGDQKGRALFPFSPSCMSVEGLASIGRNIAAILGAEAITSGRQVNGELELDFDKFLLEVESLAVACNGEKVEVTVKNGKKTRPDGTPYQNIYVNRGLGKDAEAMLEQEKQEGDAEAEAMGLKTPTAAKRVISKKK